MRRANVLGPGPIRPTLTAYQDAAKARGLRRSARSCLRGGANLVAMRYGAMQPDASDVKASLLSNDEALVLFEWLVRPTRQT